MDAPSTASGSRRRLRWRAQPQLRTSVGDVYEMRRVTAAGRDAGHPRPRRRPHRRPADHQGRQALPGGGARPDRRVRAARERRVQDRARRPGHRGCTPPLRIRVERGGDERGRGGPGACAAISRARCTAGCRSGRRSRWSPRERSGGPRTRHDSSRSPEGSTCSTTTSPLSMRGATHLPTSASVDLHREPGGRVMMGDQWGRHDNMRWHDGGGVHRLHGRATTSSASACRASR